MIIAELSGNMLDSTIQTLVCPVNTVGVMGNGLARYFSIRFPDLLPAYKEACIAKVFSREGVFVYEISPVKKILCFPTKRNWRNPSKLEWITDALDTIAKNYKQLGITSLAIPAVGCGKGELEWTDVYPLIIEKLGPIDLEVTVFLP